MARGVKVADIYAELNLDRDAARTALRGVPAALGPDADRAGHELGKRMSDGLAKAVEASSARLAKARRAEVDATNAVKVAELRLNEAREKGSRPASQLLSLENALEKAHYRLNQAQQATATSTKKLDDAQRALGRSMDDIGRDLGPGAQKAGDDAGGKLALGMRMSLVRNSPLIVAAIGAGLVAGAPLALAAATGLFAGIGIVSAAQSEKVQSAWLGTWHRVRDGATADAAVIEPALVGMADQVGDAYERMRPRLRGAFEDAAPQIAVFTDGVLGLAENALPGLERAVERGMPVTQGLAAFLEKTGTGLSDFFDRISAHAPEAGDAFSGLGDTMGTLLPLTGELLGQGAELATVVLPMLNGTLGLTLSVVTALGPALPAVVAGIGALKIAQAVSGGVSTLVDKFNALDTGSGRIRGGMDKLAGVMTPVNVATGALAIGVGIVTAAIQASDDQVREWSDALREGGAAARIAGDEMSAQEAKIRDLSTGIKGATVEVSGMSGILGIFKNDAEDARQATDDWWKSLDPVSQAQAKVAEWTATLSDRLRDENATTADVEAAKRRLAYWADQETAAQNDLEMATRGVTEAMIAQADQALASIDSDFAYQRALDGLEDSQRELAEARRDHGAASEEATDAEREFGEGLLQTAEAAGRAKADMSGLQSGTAEYARVVQTEALAELYRLRDAFPEMTPVINGMIERLEAAGVSLDEVGKYHPTPVVDADTNPLQGKAASATNVLAMLAGQRPIPVVQLNDSPFQGTYGADMATIWTLAAQRPTPWAGMNDSLLRSSYNASMFLLGTLGGQRPNPLATLTALTGSAEAALNYAARNRTSTVFQSVVTTGSAPVSALGGKVGDTVAAWRGFAGGGKLFGPGGPMDDLIPARVRETGEPIRVSNLEWVINGAVSKAQGDRRMSALNSGRADIVMKDFRRSAPRLVPGTSVSNGGGGDAGSASSSSQGGGRSVIVQRVDVHLQGFDIRDRVEVRRFAKALRDEFVALERAEN